MMMSLILFCVLLIMMFFFFKQKTAYEMRISDWSSDVCSSDLDGVRAADDAFYTSARSGASSSENERGDSERRLTPRTPTDHILLHHGSFTTKLAKKIDSVYGPFVNVDASEIGLVLAPFLPHGVLQHAMTAETLAPAGHRVKT